MKENSYCVRCKSKTGSKDSKLCVTKNGRKMLKSKCLKCGITKCCFTTK
jgi:hypothetical protein